MFRLIDKKKIAILQKKNCLITGPIISRCVINGMHCTLIYYIPIHETSFELSVFWPSDTESQINELRFSDSISLSFKTRLTSVTCFCGNVT